ncbi:hypothetical protein BOTBODRAFT_128303 [Botryobasidium botryosum FD-172 SS1]|uniref:Glucose-methanol-choline oxidoreductase N-terminal domain-containing protein n=1 Tax=Botryobasidium botryosum (strain FD-172 SS1) TaxID=930990 RepID=A0A067MR46_BOTB1|nr:hypothetical protein BOTBODRAFT_128303 [Botryobasidium botryosum FD-172 SS1]
MPQIPAVESFVKTEFDVVIIGAGTAALPIAAKLSQNPDVHVGVLEAGLKFENDPLIDTPQFIGRSVGNPRYDWAFATVPQEHANGRTVPTPRGKGVGGSTLINYTAWDRASKQEYDAWKLLGEPGGAWGWDALLPYLKASERAPSTLQSRDDSNKEAVGRQGPVQTSYSSIHTDIIALLFKAWNSIGVATNPNPWGGDASGLYFTARSVDADTGKRVSAADAYLTPEIAGRKNLQVLTRAHVTKVLFDSEPDFAGNIVARGVEFAVDGTTFAVNASKEVIICAGAVQTPQILELSGIGNKKLLTDLRIKTLVDLPGVGENIQDHCFTPMQFELKPGIRTFDILRNDPEFLAEQQRIYDSEKKGWLTASDSTVSFNPLRQVVSPGVFTSMLERLEAAIDKDKREGLLTPLQEAQYAIQLDLLRKGEVPSLETFVMSRGYIAPEQGKSYYVLMSGPTQPFGRGSIHIESTDPFKAPLIDPKYGSNAFDVEMHLAGYRLMERLVATQPLKEVTEVRQLPPANVSDDGQVIEFIRAASRTGSHLMGSCALARRELRGVVDNNLRVYGTANLRVADASIIPLSVGCHIQATVYAIGEKAGDLIKQDL